MRGIKRFFSQLPYYLLWLLASALLWSWIVGLMTDTQPAKKITFFLNVDAVEEAALSDALEAALPPGLRMVKAHAFSYALFNQDAIRRADVLVVPASQMAEFLPDLAALDVSPSAETWTDGGAVYGLRCYDAQSGAGAAQDYVRYPAPDAAPEDFYLCLTKESPHLDDGAALRVAERYLGLE